MTRFFNLTPGLDNLIGLPDDYNAFQLAPTTLQSTDIVTGRASGSFLDIILVTAAGSLTGSQFSQVTNIEELELSRAGNDVTLTDNLVAGSSLGYFAVVDGGGNNTIDASAISSESIVFFANHGSDVFKGGDGDDAVVITPTDLGPASTIQGGAGIDNVYFNEAGTIGAPAFAHVSGIEGLVLANGTNSVTLTDGLVADTAIGYLAVAGNQGDDTVDASNIDNHISIAFIGTAGGSDTFTGGNGGDSFLFEGGQLSAADTIVGGGGPDTLWMTTAGTTSAAALAHVSGIEGVFLQEGGTFDFADGITEATTFAAVGSAATDTFDASAVRTYGVTFVGNGGADILKGGSQDDTFFVSDSAFASVDGNGGNDRIVLTGSSASFDLTFNANKIHGIEVISMENVDHGNITLTGDDISKVTDDNTLYIIGDPGDSYSAGNGYTQIASGVVNNAVAPNHTFFEFQHDSGSLLFVDSFIFDTELNDPAVSVEPENSPAAKIVYSNPATFPAGTAISYALAGPDADQFNIDPASGNVTFKSSPDYENPLDQDHNNRYEFTVTTSNDIAIPTTTKFVTAVVTDLNDNAPVFASGTSASTPENVASTTPVYVAHANDADGTATNRSVSYSLTSGGDNDLFNVDAVNGTVTFKSSPDYEAPLDSGADNQYDITILASDGLHSHDASLHVAITVNDVLLL